MSGLTAVAMLAGISNASADIIPTLGRVRLGFLSYRRKGGFKFRVV